MSFNRPLYDYCEGKKRIQESTQAANYNVQTPVICGNCLPDDPRIHPNRTGVSMNSGVDWRFYAGPVDVESDLFNLNRVASNCPKNKYYPDARNCKAVNQGQPAGAGVISTTMPARGGGLVEGFESKPKEGLFRKNGQRCTDNNLVDFPSCSFNTEDTRLSNPPATLRGTGINRFQPLGLNPQAKIFFPGEYHTSTRLVFRDNHRPCIPSLKVISEPPLPPAKRLPCHKTVPTCGAPTQPMYQYDVFG
jgi:hypothetical protein